MQEPAAPPEPIHRQPKPLELIRDVPTRWGSLLLMIRRILELWPFLQQMIESNKLTGLVSASDMPTEEDVKLLRDIADLLKPFEEATTLAGGNSYPTLCLIPDLIHRLKSRLTAPRFGLDCNPIHEKPVI